MKRLEGLVVGLLFLLALSTFIKEPKTIDWMKVSANRIACREPICIIAKAEIGAIFDKELYDKVRKDTLNGSVYEALSFLSSVNDEKVREKFSEKIDSELKDVPKDDLQKNLLLASELNYEFENDPSDNDTAVKLDNTMGVLRGNKSNDFLYFYTMKTIDKGYSKNLQENENMSRTSILLLKFEKMDLMKFLFGFPKEINEIAGGLENEARNEKDQIKLSGDLIALSYFYLGAYPTLILRGFLFEILSAYALPLLFIIVFQAITYLTLKGDDKKVLFQKEHARVVVLNSVLVLILFPLLVNLFLLFPSPPGVIYLIFILPVVLPVGINWWMSSKLESEYGVAESGRGFLKMRIKENLLITFLGAIIAILIIGVVVNVKRIFAQLSFRLISLFIAVFVLVLLSVFIVMAMPHITELVFGSHEIKNEELRKRIEALVEKFGYSATKIRVIPSIGSGLTNAFQSGFLGENVKIFVSETLMDESKFTCREVEAVMAHELAHIKEKHTPKTVVGYISISSILILLFASATSFLETVDLPQIAEYMSLFGGYVAILLSIIATFWISRKFEYDADKKAAQMGYGDDLISALSKMYELNLMPAKLSKTVNFFSSHGDLDARIRFLNKIKEDYRSNL